MLTLAGAIVLIPVSVAPVIPVISALTATITVVVIMPAVVAVTIIAIVIVASIAGTIITRTTISGIYHYPRCRHRYGYGRNKYSCMGAVPARPVMPGVRSCFACNC